MSAGRAGQGGGGRAGARGHALLHPTAAPAPPPPPPLSTRYLGEWYEPKAAGGEPLDEQRRAAAANCAKVAWMYAATGAASALGLAYHRVARR